MNKHLGILLKSNLSQIRHVEGSYSGPRLPAHPLHLLGFTRHRFYFVPHRSSWYNIDVAASVFHLFHKHLLFLRSGDKGALGTNGTENGVITAPNYHMWKLNNPVAPWYYQNTFRAWAFFSPFSMVDLESQHQRLHDI